jgi:DNA-directed RNA polymerase subunit RPC12/RpoP
MLSVPCWLCGKQLDRRIDKNGKYYLVCNLCGMQVFIRREQGMRNLSDLIKTLKNRDLPFRHHTRTLYEIQATLAEIRGIKEEMKSLDSVFNLFSNDKDTKHTRKLLRTRIDRLFLTLEKIARA